MEEGVVIVFFFKQKTAYEVLVSDWSSDVCCSDRAIGTNTTAVGDNAVSWRLADPDGAVNTAILVPDATRDRFRVLGYNVTDAPLAATMSTWNVTAGTWDMRVGTSADGGKTVRWSGGPRSLTLERSAATDVRFQPGTTTILDFRLVEATTPTHQRHDLGHGCDEVAISTHAVPTKDHTPRPRPGARTTARLEAADGRVLATDRKSTRLNSSH